MNERQLRADIRKRVKVEYGGSQRAAAKAWEVAEPQVHYTITGKRKPSPSLIKNAGYKVVYQKV